MSAKKDLREISVQTVKLFQQKEYAKALPLAEKAVALAKQIYGEKKYRNGERSQKSGLCSIV